MEKAKTMIRMLAFITAILAGIATTYATGYASDVYIMDNADSSVELIGQWQTSTWNGGDAYYGPNYLHDQNQEKGAKSVKFNPVLDAGDYAVYIRYTASVNRADNVPVDLIYGGPDSFFYP